jgi:hypothetical protein
MHTEHVFLAFDWNGYDMKAAWDLGVGLGLPGLAGGFGGYFAGAGLAKFSESKDGPDLAGLSWIYYVPCILIGIFIVVNLWTWLLAQVTKP